MFEFLRRNREWAMRRDRDITKRHDLVCCPFEARLPFNRIVAELEAKSVLAVHLGRVHLLNFWFRSWIKILRRNQRFAYAPQRKSQGGSAAQGVQLISQGDFDFRYICHPESLPVLLRRDPQELVHAIERLAANLVVDLSHKMERWGIGSSEVCRLGRFLQEARGFFFCGEGLGAGRNGAERENYKQK